MDADGNEHECEEAAMDDEGDYQYEDEGEDQYEEEDADQGAQREEELFGQGGQGGEGGGYTTAGATSGDDDDEDGDYFATGLDVDQLLQVGLGGV
jgi:hypothetical protein